MTTHLSLFSRLAVTATVVASLMPLPAGAQSENPGSMLLMRPHCENPSDTTGSAPTFSEFMRSGVGDCKNYSARDPQTQQTSAMNIGDVLDMDIVVFNPTHASITSARAWLSYDPQTLQGVGVELKDLPVPTPGEADFSAAEGLAKLNASAAPSQKVDSWLVTVARVKLRVLRAPRAGISPLGFYDLQPGKEGHTRVLANVDGQEKNLLPSELGTLVVVINPAPASSSSSSSQGTVIQPPVSSSSVPIEPPSSSVSSDSSSSQPMEGDRSPFVLLQVQNLRATTEGGSISVAWNKLPSSNVVGYNLYYGTEKGRYIQRKSITSDTSSDIIRGLPVNTVYYLAVRAYNGQNEETAFSKEVMIKTGDPRSSTAPLSLEGGTITSGNPLQGNITGTSVPGKSGLPSGVTLLFVACAVMGTLMAFRRQLRAKNV